MTVNRAPSRVVSGLPTYTPDNPPVFRGGITSGGAAYSPADEFTGGKKGWLFDGSAGKSAFLQSAGGSVAGDGDPLGSVEDLSGNGNDILQATGGAKPTNTVTGGINAISCASSKYMGRTLASAVSVYRTVVYVICIKATSPGEAYPLLMGSGGTFDSIFNQTPGVTTGSVTDNNAYIGPVSCDTANQPYIVIYKKYDDAGTKRVNVKVYRLSNGTLVDDETYAAPSTNGVDLIDIGYPTPQPAFQIPFHMGIDGAPDLTNVLTYIYDNFAGWAP